VGTPVGSVPAPISWAELARHSLARQFPAADSVPDLVRRIGPIQAQAARAPFLGIATRLAAADHRAIVEAYEHLELVRGSNIEFFFDSADKLYWMSCFDMYL